MLSIIVCSRSAKLLEKFIENIQKTIGVDYEIISIDNSENKYSIFSAYNEGFARSKYLYLCFVHEDVVFHTQNWGKIVIDHLQDPKTGILGLAGGDLAPVVPAMWWALTPTEKIIQTDPTEKKPSLNNCYPINYDKPTRSVVLLDGVFLCMRRQLFENIKFDETLCGFHSYDFDISIQSILAGYYNYVIFDVSVEHFSMGNMNGEYYRNLIKVYKKWEKQLPLVEHKISKEDQKSLIPKIEERNLLRLVKKLTRAGFSTNEIVDLTTYYSYLIDSKKCIQRLKILRLRILFIRISSFIRNKNNY
jgi:hypothetical protein